MISAIQNGMGYNDQLMDQPNVADKTPRQILEETRARWEQVELTISQSTWSSDARN